MVRGKRPLVVGAPHAALSTRVTDGGRVALVVVIDHGGKVGGGGLVAVPAAVAADGLRQVRPEGLADVVVGLRIDNQEGGHLLCHVSCAGPSRSLSF